ncbi:peptidase M16 inactive domain protein [Dictyocaulus viviparus]|uniref:Peptidase M16 inactive domain protein n=1 Tax=Dictyocaulus viviparus TaxID=29172 RepID=A0A0D8Y314_DICVI|nr:peptidase M16 inactive domain protein [Dictyocaulus viviparus]
MILRFWTKSEVLMNGTIAVALYRSTRSRLTVAVGDVPGPMVKGCISFVTEADSDDGLPHTLEHLVFMGSKKYPVKGVLDIIASRCLASGTNAWTDQDHTAYTLSTVGSEGFFKVLPVYLDHLLSPTLTVRDFHKRFYHLSNMMVVVAGRINHERLLRIIEATEEEHLPNNPPNFQRPFSVDLKPPVESSEHRIVCPSDDESRGMVEICWFGYQPSEFQEKVALDVLFDYLSNTPVSPLQREFVLVEKPLASSVNFHVTEQMEKYPASELFGHMIGHQLYDTNDGHLKSRVNELELVRHLHLKPASFWSGLVSKYLANPHIAIIGVPSVKMVTEVADGEKVRLEQQREKLGVDGVKRCGEEIEKAIKENTSKKASAELLNELIVERLESFDRFPVDAKCNDERPMKSEEIARFLEQFPFPATVHNCPTKFIELFFLLDSSALTMEQRAWLHLFTELLFESAAIVHGQQMSAEAVAKLYTKDLVDYSIQVGISRYYEKFVNLRLVVDAETGFPNLAKWAEIFTIGIVFDIQRVKQCAKKLASSAREKKRDGCSVASTALASMLYEQNTNGHMYNEIVLEKFHERVAKLCDTQPKEVINNLEELRAALLSRGVNAHIVCDVDLIDNKYFNTHQWNFVNKNFGNSVKFKVKAGDTVNASCVGKQMVVGVGGSESSFIYQTCLMDCDWMSEALVPTMLLSQYLSQFEGKHINIIYHYSIILLDISPSSCIFRCKEAHKATLGEVVVNRPLYRGVRGVGLAYSVNIFVKADKRTLTLSLYRCSQPAQAYEATKRIVTDVINSSTVVESDFEAAKRSLICEVTEQEETVSGAGKLSIIRHIRGSAPDYQKQLCQRIWNTSIGEMFRLGGPRVTTLFENYTRAIAVHPARLNEIKSAFPGIEEVKITSLTFSPCVVAA